MQSEDCARSVLSSRARSELIQTAYDEFCDRVEEGEAVSPSLFVRRYPAVERRLRRLLDAHQVIHAHASGTWPSAGQTIGTFELLEEIGRGSFSRVFTASDTALGHRTVVLKVNHGSSAEAARLGQLEHPRIVPVLSTHDLPGGLHGLCMPYLGRATLLDVIDSAFAKAEPPTRIALDPLLRGHAPGQGRVASVRADYIEVVLRVGIAAAKALGYAHGRGIAHGDVKPSNVLIGEDGTPRLIDFNLAQEVSADAAGGTLPYMSSTRLRSLVSGEADVATQNDVFALAVTLYEALTGAVPFELGDDVPGIDAAASLLARRAKGLVPVRQRNPRVDGHLASLLETVIKEECSVTADEFAERLRRCQGIASRASRFVRGHRAVSAALAALVLLAALGAASYFQSLPPVEERLMSQGTALLYESPQRALACFERVLRSSPTHRDAQRGRALALLGAGDADAAYAALLSLEHDDADAPVQQALAYCIAAVDRENERAINIYTRLIRSGDLSTATLNNIGHCEIRFSRFDDAERHLRMSSQRAPKHPTVAYNLAALERARAVAEGRAPNPASARNASALAPQAANVHLDTAVVLALASRRAQSPRTAAGLRGESLEYARLAVENGMDGTRLSLLSRLLPEIAKEPQFLALQATTATGPAEHLPRLINPVVDR